MGRHIDHINLLPEELRPEISILSFSRQIGPVWYGALLASYFLVSVGYYQISMTLKRRQIAQLKIQDQELIQKITPLREKVTLLEKRKQRLASMQSILKHKSGWSETFKEFSQLLPKGVWFTALSGAYSDTPRRFLVKGEAVSQAKMADFLSKLERSQLFGDTTVIFSEREMDVDPEVYRFELSVSLKESAPDEGST